MRKLIHRVTLRSIGWIQTVPWREWLYVGVPIAVALLLAFWVTARYVKPAPPSRVVLATGPEGGAYRAFGEAYAALLARDRITLELRTSAGPRENYRLLRDGTEGVDVAFVRSGIGSPEEAPHLVSLGAVAYEALWVFCRGDRVLDDLPGLRGRTIVVGARGAGTRRLVRTLLAANGIDEDDFTALEIGGLAAAEALLAGVADCAFIFEPPDSGLVKALLYSPAAQLVDFTRRGAAYTKKIPFLTTVVLPEGANDLAANLPPRPVTLLATETELIARQDLHPAIQSLLLQAASEVHEDVGLFNRQREFPAAHKLDFPVSDDAKRYYTSGRPFLQRYLPFWLANLVDRLLVFLLPAVAIVFPLVRILPPLYAWQVRRRIYRWYGELMFIENEMRRTLTAGEKRDFGARLDWIEREVNGLRMPLAFANQLYLLRQHIEFVQHKLEQLTSGGESGESEQAARREA
jgi:TRAP-type uncharacterized transport system substrate-binding protein